MCICILFCDHKLTFNSYNISKSALPDMYSRFLKVHSAQGRVRAYRILQIILGGKVLQFLRIN